MVQLRGRPFACSILCALLLAGACNAGSATTTLTVSARILRPPAAIMRDEAVVTITDGSGKTHVLNSEQRFRFSKDPEGVIREIISTADSDQPILIEILY